MGGGEGWTPYTLPVDWLLYMGEKITRNLGSSYCDPQSIKTLTISPAWSGSENFLLVGG